MNAKRELERIIAEGNIEECSAVTIAEAILAKLPELGFVRLADVEIDLRKLATLLMGLAHQRATGVRRTWYKEAELINKMKGILRVRG